MLDARGLIYVVDRLAGLDILEFGGSTTGSMIPKSMSSTRSGMV